jgi:hypothetical protein
MLMSAEVKKKNGVWRGNAGLKLNVALVGPDMRNDTGRLQQGNSAVTT